jgi:hypothetical protein
MRRVLYNGRLRSELVLRGEVGLPCPGAPKYHLRGFRLRETPTVEKSPQDTGPYFWPVKPSKENSHVYIQRKAR